MSLTQIPFICCTSTTVLSRCYPLICLQAHIQQGTHLQFTNWKADWIRRSSVVNLVLCLRHCWRSPSSVGALRQEAWTWETSAKGAKTYVVFFIIWYDNSAPLEAGRRPDQTSCTNHISHPEQVIMKREKSDGEGEGGGGGLKSSRERERENMTGGRRRKD